jgi:hypothetical protein
VDTIPALIAAAAVSLGVFLAGLIAVRHLHAEESERPEGTVDQLLEMFRD